MEKQIEFSNNTDVFVVLQSRLKPTSSAPRQHTAAAAYFLCFTPLPQPSSPSVAAASLCL
jgi:hypothetical protein